MAEKKCDIAKLFAELQDPRIKRSIQIVQQAQPASAEAKQMAEDMNKRLTEIENGAPTVNVPAEIGPLMRVSPSVTALITDRP